MQTHAADNAWNNSSGNSFWDLSSANWGCPPIWADGDNAFFSGAGASPSGLGTSVTLNSAITAHSVTINGTNYAITGAGNSLTLAGTTPTIISSASSNNLAVSIAGTDGLTFQGPGTTALLGDAALAPNLGSTYTGGTYVRSGTLILGVGAFGGAALSSSSYAVDSIEAIDVGATVREGNFNDGLDTATSDIKVPNGQIPVSGVGSGLLAPHRLNLTGGTYDTYANDNNQQQPQPSGWGTIINTCPVARGILKYTGYGETTEFAGQIMDGGITVARANNGPGYQMNVDSQGGSAASVLILSGSNSFTGFLRIGNAATIQLKGAGTIGYPAPINCPARQVIQNNGVLDLNGTSQKTGVYWTKGDADGAPASRITNSAFGTVSTLTLCYNATNLTVPTTSGSQGGISCSIKDDPTTGGTIGITKEGTAVQVLGANDGVNSVKGTSVNDYHGDTVVNNGILRIMVASAISPNSAYRLNTTRGTLDLAFADTATVRQLWIDGVPQPNGDYSSSSTPAITGTGTLTVTGADFNRWNNGSANSLWDSASANWTSPTVWTDSNSALFDALGANPSGAGTSITLGAPITAHEIAVAGTNYVINGAGNALTLDGVTPTITSTASSNVIAASLSGTTGLTFTGGGTTVLTDDGVDGNHYTGGTYVHSGTVVLANGKATSSGSAYAVDSIEALDAGATLVIPGTWNGTNGATSVRDQIAATVVGSRLHMTGGTLDLHNDAKNQRIPVPEGTGLIINSGPNIQAGLQMVADGLDHTFAGVIADGNNGVLSTNNNLNGGPGYQIGIVTFGNAKNGGGGLWTLSGSNTYSGSTRIDNGASIKLEGNGTIGFPSPNGLTGPLRIYGQADPAKGYLDLNGHNQTIALMQAGNTDAKIFNSAVGTVSTLTIGYGNEQANRTCGFQLMDNQGTGGILALTKIITAPYLIAPAYTILATNCAQELTGVCTYSGDTTVKGGSLILSAATAVSPNSAYRLSASNYALLKLNYSGTASVRQLWINGVQQPNGVYGAGTPGIDPASTGTVTVTGADPALVFSTSGSTLNLSWAGTGYKLVFATSVTGPWSDYPCGGTSPVAITIGSGSKFFRLSK